VKFHHPTAEIFVPDGTELRAAVTRITHLGIGAHQDDLEFMAFHGILECFASDRKWFGGVTCGDGAGSVRNGDLVAFSDARIKEERRLEQNKAAVIGGYGAMIQLDYSSSAIKNPDDSHLKDDLLSILDATRPEVVYTHNPADKHGTHISVVIAAIRALREMPGEARPGQVIGCELWRDLDWMPDAEKVLMDVSDGDQLAAELHAVFQSQLAGGKHYDIATIGRRSANTTFLDPHNRDATRKVIVGMDLTPLVHDETLDTVEFVSGFIERFHGEVKRELLQKLASA
jgi:LmbE family N-acetylglucosaminyl deacetylase